MISINQSNCFKVGIMNIFPKTESIVLIFLILRIGCLTLTMLSFGLQTLAHTLHAQRRSHNIFKTSNKILFFLKIIIIATIFASTKFLNISLNILKFFLIILKYNIKLKLFNSLLTYYQINIW